MNRIRYVFPAWLLLFLTVAELSGCSEVRPGAVEEPASISDLAGTSFDASTAGTIRGTVTWGGVIPAVPPFEIVPNLLSGELLQKKQVRANPNAPVIDPRTRGVANAVVYLKGIDPRKGKRWSHSAVRVEQRNGEFHVLQDNVDSRFGCVRRGDLVEMVSRDRFFHSLHAGGAAFFTLAFPDHNQLLGRRLKESGIVELSSAAGYYWMRAYLCVDEHPYYCQTDAEGRFELSQVPPGHYEVVCWMPHWKKARHERDPESGLVVRVFFDPPFEVVHSVALKPNEKAEVGFVLTQDLANDSHK